MSLLVSSTIKQSPHENRSLLAAFLENNRAYMCNLSHNQVQIKKISETQIGNTFEMLCKIQVLKIHVFVEIRINDQKLLKRIKQIGEGTLLIKINNINSQQQNDFTISWDSQKNELLFRAFFPRFENIRDFLQKSLKKYWDFLINFYTSIFPEKKQPALLFTQNQMRLNTDTKFSQWKQQIITRKKYQQSRPLDNIQKNVNRWFYEQQFYKNLLYKIQQSNTQEQSILRYFTLIYSQNIQSEIMGNLCNIQTLKANYQIITMDLSLNSGYNQYITQTEVYKQKQSESIPEQIQGQLIKKSPLKWDRDPFDRQKQIVHLIRNKRCRNIGSYFYQYSDLLKKQKQDCLYMPKYEYSYKQNLSKLNIFKKSQQLVKGVLFMCINGLVHRDLKPSNVMIDQNYCPKIIDFGSAVQIKQKNKQKQGCQIRTTIKYNLVWQKLPNQLRKLITQPQYNTHPFFDIYALGKIFEVSFKQYDLKNKIGHILDDHLTFVINQCLNINPYERLHPIQIIKFLQILTKYES